MKGQDCWIVLALFLLPLSLEERTCFLTKPNILYLILLLLVVMMTFAQAFQKNFMLRQALEELFLYETSAMAKRAEDKDCKRKLISVPN